MSIPTEPAPLRPGATPQEREQWRKDNERFLMEGGRKGVAMAPTKIDPTDVRLRQLRLEAGRFLELHSPMKAALWLALLRPEKDIVHDAEMSRRFAEAQRLGIDGQAHVAPDRPSIVGIAQRLVASALAGDVSAIDRIADRIEGKAGLRIGDEDEGDPAKRRQASDITERVISQLTRRRIEDMNPGKAAVIDVTPTQVPSEEKVDEARSMESAVGDA